MPHFVAEVTSQRLPQASVAVAANVTVLPWVTAETEGLIVMVEAVEECAAIEKWVIAEFAAVADAVMVEVPAAVSL